MRRVIVFLLGILLLVSCGSKNSYILNEDTFFLVMTNITYYPEQYIDKELQLDCYTYTLTDVNDEEYTCVVRKCSSGYGCNCGKDTVIGFITDRSDLPEPINQSSDTNDKAWIHITGYIRTNEKKKIRIYAYDSNGNIDRNTVETIEFLFIDITEFNVITDYSNLNYYVTK